MRGSKDRGEKEGGREIVRPRALVGGPGKSLPKIHEKCKTSANTGQIWITQKSPKRHVTKSTLEKYCRLYNMFLW